MIVFETHPNKYLVYFAPGYLPTLVDMDAKYPVGVCVDIVDTSNVFLDEGYIPLEYADIPLDTRRVIVSCLSVLYENAQIKVTQLKYDIERK